MRRSIVTYDWIEENGKVTRQTLNLVAEDKPDGPTMKVHKSKWGSIATLRKHPRVTNWQTDGYECSDYPVL